MEPNTEVQTNKPSPMVIVGGGLILVLLVVFFILMRKPGTNQKLKTRRITSRPLFQRQNQLLLDLEDLKLPLLQQVFLLDRMWLLQFPVILWEKKSLDMTVW